MKQDNTELASTATRAALAHTIGRWTKGSEDLPTPISGLAFFRREAPTPPGICRVEPSIVLVVQGTKRMLAGNDAYDYDTDRYLIASFDVAASSEVVQASSDRPCLGLVLKLDLRMLTELVAQTHLPQPNTRPVVTGMAIGTVTPTLLESFKRLTDLLDDPGAREVLAPMIQREIHYWLLRNDETGRLRELASVGSQSHHIARAIDWLKANYTSPLRIAELAARVHMSVSSLHHHFRLLTAMSPLQYQKWLRLNEAKRLMLNEGADAANAAFRVGYESPSQFSREYARHYGAPPKRDISGLRRTSA